MTIENPEEYLKNIWDWAILQGCFGDTKIEPTDIDGLVERNGKFLWLETKAPGVELKKGQSITFERLAARGDTVLIIWGIKDNPIKIRLYYKKSVRTYDPASIEVLRDITKKWFSWADGKTP